jgi:hypothetical protein
MGGAGAGGEREKCRRGVDGDTRRLAVRRRLIERASERATVRIADRGTVQPIDATERRADRGQGPLAPRRIGDREARRFAARVVARENLIAGAVPAIVALVVGRRYAGAHVGPPSRRRRVALERVELDESSGGALALPGHAETDRRLSVHVGQNEAALVKVEARQRGRGATVTRVHVGAVAENRVALGFIYMAARRLEPAASGRTEQIRDAGRLT